MDADLLKRLSLLALRLSLGLGASALVLYIGLVYFREVFDKVVYMIAPPLIALGGLAENRTKRKVFGLHNTKLSRIQVIAILTFVIVYALIVYALFDRFEDFFIVVPTLAAFAYCIWLGAISRKEYRTKEKS